MLSWRVQLPVDNLDPGRIFRPQASGTVHWSCASGMRRSARSPRTSACTNRSCGPRAHPLVLPRRLPRRAARATAPDQHMRVGSHRALHPAPVARVRVVIGEGFDVDDRLQRRPSASCHGAATAESAVVSTFLRAKPSLVAGRSSRRLELSLSKPATAKPMRSFGAHSWCEAEFSTHQVTPMKKYSRDEEKTVPMVSSTLPRGDPPSWA